MTPGRNSIVPCPSAGCKSSITGDDFYGTYDAQEFAQANAKELGIQTVNSLDLVYTQEKGALPSLLPAAF